MGHKGGMKISVILFDLACILCAYCVRIVPILPKIAFERACIAMRDKDPFRPGGADSAYQPVPIRMVRHDEPAVHRPPAAQAAYRHPP